MFATDAGVARVVFVTSDSDRAATAVVFAGDGAKTLRDGVTGETLHVETGRFTIRFIRAAFESSSSPRST